MKWPCTAAPVVLVTWTRTASSSWVWFEVRIPTTRTSRGADRKAQAVVPRVATATAATSAGPHRRPVNRGTGPARAEPGVGRLRLRQPEVVDQPGRAGQGGDAHRRGQTGRDQIQEVAGQAATGHEQGHRQQQEPDAAEAGLPDHERGEQGDDGQRPGHGQEGQRHPAGEPVEGDAHQSLAVGDQGAGEGKDHAPEPGGRVPDDEGQVDEEEDADHHGQVGAGGGQGGGEPPLPTSDGDGHAEHEEGDAEPGCLFDGTGQPERHRTRPTGPRRLNGRRRNPGVRRTGPSATRPPPGRAGTGRRCRRWRTRRRTTRSTGPAGPATGGERGRARTAGRR